MLLFVARIRSQKKKSRPTSGGLNFRTIVRHIWRFFFRQTTVTLMGSVGALGIPSGS